MADQKKLMRVPNLPMEIIREILGWLPVKSLCRFRNYNDVSSMVLLSFVLADEEVQEIPLPPDFLVDFDIENLEDEKYYFLDVFQECLCVGKNDDLRFWVMIGKSYKVDFVGCYLESLVSPNHYHMIDGEH
ncbi:hypothetical protein M0R45_017562 [Rubus argutus]|uniref:F-box domain-containing protein n=1 Tax=Rubus argutus TaxID=59490 RepID=A0AAW1XW95_RUBAR